MRLFVPPVIHFFFPLITVFFPFYLIGTERSDFALNLEGGGLYCTGDHVPVEVYGDFNLTGGNDSSVRGFSIAICNLSYQLEIIEALPGDSLKPETGTKVDFMQITVMPRGVIQGVIVDMKEARGIPPANHLHLLSLEYNVLDATDTAYITPCNKTLGNPNVIISFSTGNQIFYPPEENLHGIEISSPCTDKRTFHLRSKLKGPLKVQCDTGEGSTFIDILIKEDPIFCCSPRLVRGLSLALRLPEDIKVKRYLPGDFALAGQASSFEGNLYHANITYLAGVRFGDEYSALRIEIETKPEYWINQENDAIREIVLEDQGNMGTQTGLVYINGGTAPFKDLTKGTTTFSVMPRCPNFIRGDINSDGFVNIADAIFILSWLYGAKEQPGCLDSSDSNDDGRIDIGDAIFILNNTFNTGKPFPFPGKICGRDPTDDNLDCEDSEYCNL